VLSKSLANGDDIRRPPLSMRKANLSHLLARRVDGIFLSDFEQGEIGRDLFRHACLMGLEGMVSMHRDRPYRTGRSPHWVKVKNREHAFSRVQDQSG
jgi:bifunctional non-homologous end joining protein LigD